MLRFLVALLALCACSLRHNQATAPASASANTSSAPVPGLSQDEISRLLHDIWQKAGVTPAPAASDAEFLRRVTLDLAGRTPSADEASAFLRDSSPDKRARWVDTLLASPDYAEHWADVFLNLSLTSEAKRIARLESPRAYWVESFSSNKPYDQIARDLLTATGDLKDNGAGSFLLAQSRAGGAERVAASTARLFLGIQLQCAQCHDHPYDPRYKQEDFYGLVAYFSRTRGRPNKEEMSFSIVDVPRGEAKMKRPGSTKEEKVEPRFLGHALDQGSEETRREALTRALIQSDLFAKAAVNRAWAQLFGRGLVDPWDDLGGENDPAHPPLLSALAEDFRRNGFDQKSLLKKMVLSEAYARSSQGEKQPENNPQQAERVFARAALRPLSPEQLFRSLLQATNFEEVARARAGEEKIAKALQKARREYVFVFGDDEMGESDSFDGNTPQSLLLLNGELTNRGVLARPNSALRRILESSRDPKERLQQLFLATYGRHPSTEEEASLLPALDTQRDAKPYEDLFFALLTSTEFLTNH